LTLSNINVYIIVNLRGEKLDNDVIIRQFDDIEEKVAFLIEFCQSLEATNTELQEKIKNLEQELQSRSESESHYNEQKNLIQSKINSLVEKLNNVSALS
jgi:FtsZ-binding cell division protein ZapB